MPWCRHRITWDRDCSACEAEDDAWDPVSIEHMFESFHRLEILKAHRDQRMPEPDKDFQAAIRVWSDQSRNWHKRHDVFDLGGEA